MTGINTGQEQLVALDQQLKTLRAAYDASIQSFLAVADATWEQQSDAFNSFHTAGVAYFNAHEHAISLDSRLNVDLNSTCFTERAETSANVLEVIGNHYQALRQWASDLGIDPNTLRPSLTAFASMQRRVAETQPDIAAQLRAKFAELDLPTRGFDTPEAKSSRTKGGFPEGPLGAYTTNNFYAPTSGFAIGDGASVVVGSNSALHKGDQQMGDKISISGDVTGSAVGSHASLKARDIVTAVNKSQRLDGDLKQKLAQAAEMLAELKIPEGDKADAADDLEKLRAELEKPTRDEGRIQKIWSRIKEAAPTVAAVLASAVSLTKLLHGTP